MVKKLLINVLTIDLFASQVFRAELFLQLMGFQDMQMWTTKLAVMLLVRMKV